MPRPTQSAGEMLASGRWLGPRAAADKLGISERQLRLRWRRREIRREQLSPGVFLYFVE